MISNQIVTPPHENLYPLVSVVIPVYNAETTIARIIHQILGQSYQNIELILVNDGSTDGSVSAIETFTSNPRVKVFTQENKGVSAARNKGIAASNGRYITFVDADDEITPDYIKNLINAILKSNSDLCIAGYIKIPSGSVKLSNNIFDRLEYQKVIMTRDIGVAFCKIYDADIIRNNHISFPVGMKVCEDAVFYYRYILHSRRCTFIDCQDYIYYAPTSGDKKYGADLEAEYIALESMLNALIPLMQNLTLDTDGTERIRQRILLHLRRMLYAIIANPRSLRSKLYARIDWNKLMPYIKMDYLTKFILNKRLFRILEIIRIFESKILSRQLESMFR